MFRLTDGLLSKNRCRKGREQDEQMKECYLRATKQIFEPRSRYVSCPGRPFSRA